MATNFDPDAYLSSTTQKGGFDPDAYLASLEPTYVQKTVSNIIPDIKQMIKGAGQTASDWAPFMGGDAASVIPGLVKQGSQMLSNPKETAKEIVKPISHPIDYFEEHPVQQAINILGVGQLAAKGIGAALNSVPATENFVPTVERVANNQTLKSMGGTMAQLKQMQESGGREALDAAAKYARESGLTDVLSTNIGRDKLLKALLDSSGKQIGELRKAAGPAPKDLINNVLSNPKAKLGEYLGDGLASGELGKVDEALADIQRIAGPSPTHKSLADAASYINQKAAGTKLYQPVTGATDLANALSDENNQAIAQSLGPDKAKLYVDALDEQRKLHPLEHLQNRGELRDAGGRGGLGVRFLQGIADEFGYRLSAKAAEALHDSLMGTNTNLAKAALAQNALPKQTPIVDLIEQLKQKFADRRKM